MQTLRLFSDVAHCHSFSRAAARHGITQSAASQRIGQLEKRLGVRLIDRSHRPLMLTPAGRVFLEGCEALIADYDRLAHRVAQMGAGLSGTVRVAAIYSSGIELMEQLRDRFEAEHEQVRVAISYHRPEKVHEMVCSGEAELGILSYPGQWPRVGVIPLRDEQMAVVCGREHPLAELEEIEASSLSDYEFVGFDADLPVGRRIRQYLAENGARPREQNAFDNVDTIKNAVAVTEAVSILPLRTVRHEMERGILAAVPLRPALARPLGIIYCSRSKSEPVFPPATQAFVDHLTSRASREAVSPEAASGGVERQKLAGGRS